MVYPEPKEEELSETIKDEIKQKILDTNISSQEISEDFE